MKKGIIIFFVISLILLFVVIGYKVVEENKLETTSPTKVKEKVTKNDSLKQMLTCTKIESITNDDNLTVGSNIITYSFYFEKDNLKQYKKDILMAFNSENDYQNYCISCDNNEAQDIKSITKGIEITITPSMNKYIYQNVRIDLDKYDGEHKQTKYGLDGLDNKADIDDVLFMTRNMACYWEY